jgi:hypothetical protein
VQQLAIGSAAIPELTTACEELRAALTASLSSSIKVLQADVTMAPASPARTVRVTHPGSPSVTHLRASATAAATATVSGTCHSPSCHHIAQVQMTGHQGGTYCSSGSPVCCNGGAQSPAACYHSSRQGCMHCSGSSGCCCTGVYAGGAVAGGRAECSALLSGRLFDVGLTPAANRLQLRVEQLDRDLRWVC